MSCYIPRVEIPSLDGIFRVNLNDNPYKNHIYKHKNNFYVVQLLILSWTAMLADSPIDPKKPNKLIHKFIINLCTNLFDTLKIYTQLSHILTKSEIRDNSSISRSFLKDMKDTPIFREYLHYFKTGDRKSVV